MITLKQLTVKQSDTAAPCYTTAIGHMALAELASRQKRYLLRCYTAKVPPYRGEGMPIRMCDALRRVAVLHRKGKRDGLPELDGVLIPAACWYEVVGGMVVVVRGGRGGDRVPLLLDWMELRAPKEGRSCIITEGD